MSNETEQQPQPWQDQPIPELGGRSWAELEVKRHDSGKLMFKDQIRRRAPSGKVEVSNCRVCVPTPEDQVLARAATRVWFGEHEGLSVEHDQDLFDEMEQVCLLARAIRTPEEPHGQLEDHEELARYDEGSLQDLLGRMTVYKQLTDVRDTVEDENDFWTKVVAVARAGHLLPLTDIAGHAQPSFMVRMAREACNSPTAKPYVLSSEISTPEPSS